MEKVKTHYIVVEKRADGLFTSGLTYSGVKTAKRKAKWMKIAGFNAAVMKINARIIR